jgi:hypothetical protein
VYFGSQAVEFSDESFKLIDQISMLFSEFSVPVFMVSVRMPQRFDLALVSTQTIFAVDILSCHTYMFRRPLHNKIKVVLLLRDRQRPPHLLSLIRAARNMDLPSISVQKVS